MPSDPSDAAATFPPDPEAAILALARDMVAVRPAAAPDPRNSLLGVHNEVRALLRRASEVWPAWTAREVNHACEPERLYLAAMLEAERARDPWVVEDVPARVSAAWARMEMALTPAPQILASLRPPATEERLREFEERTGYRFSPAHRASLLIHDGQESVQDGEFLWCEAVYDYWGLAEVEEYARTRSYKVTSGQGWTGVGRARDGNILCVLDDAEGTLYGRGGLRDRSLLHYLERIATGLETGLFVAFEFSPVRPKS